MIRPWILRRKYVTLTVFENIIILMVTAFPSSRIYYSNTVQWYWYCILRIDSTFFIPHDIGPVFDRIKCSFSHITFFYVFPDKIKTFVAYERFRNGLTRPGLLAIFFHNKNHPKHSFSIWNTFLKNSLPNGVGLEIWNWSTCVCFQNMGGLIV